MYPIFVFDIPNGISLHLFTQTCCAIVTVLSLHGETRKFWNRPYGNGPYWWRVQMKHNSSVQAMDRTLRTPRHHFNIKTFNMKTVFSAIGNAIIKIAVMRPSYLYHVIPTGKAASLFWSDWLNVLTSPHYQDGCRILFKYEEHLSRYRDSHNKDNTTMRLSDLDNWNP